jgi:hypothetical protein
MEGKSETGEVIHHWRACYNTHLGVKQQHEHRLAHRFLKVKRNVQRRRETVDDETTATVAHYRIVQR